jgi:hypothetical protein
MHAMCSHKPCSSRAVAAQRFSDNASLHYNALHLQHQHTSTSAHLHTCTPAAVRRVGFHVVNAKTDSAAGLLAPGSVHPPVQQNGT